MGNPTENRSAVSRWIRDWWSRLIAGLALAVVAGVTGRISYTHIYDLTLALGQPPAVARLYPFGVDGLIVVGSVVLLQATADHPYLGWLGVVPGVAASVFANVESGLSRGPLAATWAGVPAVAFAVATFMFERWLKSQVRAGGRGGELSTEEALRVLLETDSQRRLADVLGIERSHVQRWTRQLARGGQEVAEDAA